MALKEISYRMAFLLPVGSDRRLIAEERDGHVFVAVDLHGLTTEAAKRLLHNIIAMIRRPFTLRIIHGYHHGTAIRDMIWTDFPNPRILEKHICIWNYGVTVAEIA